MEFSHQAVSALAGQRRKMVEEQLLSREINDPKLLEVMNRVPRHLFVHESMHHRAYGDSPLPIGENQTISQPYIVAAMTDVLQLSGEERVLEIGTGSGYQTAILAELCAQVFTIERINTLARKSQKILTGLKYFNIVYKVFDGTYGWPDQAPFDAILVTASTPQIPPMLLSQLKDNGRLIAPVGGRENQKMTVVTKEGNHLRHTIIGDCKFVPLVGKYGWSAPTAVEG
jgi:protein-L-isoaspartate(D-aspartate) O-methyltransferase